jgi:branched-chain amino acid transport system permease protein
LQEVGVQFWIIQTFNGIAYGMLLFLLAAGLSLILGMMNVSNLAHGAFYLLSSYVGYAVFKASGDFMLAVAAGALTGALLGIVTERIFMRRLLNNRLGQVLLSIGIAMVLADLCLVIWKGDPVTIRPPSYLAGSVDLIFMRFPAYRLFIIASGLFILVALNLVLSRTKLGAMIRAAVDNQEMARAMGINIEVIFMGTFAFGCMLAGLAGVLGLPFLSAYPGLDWELLPLALVVVIVGGVGSVNGAILGALLLGLLDNYGRALFPGLSYFTLFVPMIFILAFRPSGLLPRR